VRPFASEARLPPHLEAEISLEMVAPHLVVDLAIGWRLLVGVFFDQTCFEVVIQVWWLHISMCHMSESLGLT
jgi:hypothetical protein